MLIWWSEFSCIFVLAMHASMITPQPRGLAMETSSSVMFFLSVESTKKMEVHNFQSRSWFKQIRIIACFLRDSCSGWHGSKWSQLWLHRDLPSQEQEYNSWPTNAFWPTTWSLFLSIWWHLCCSWWLQTQGGRCWEHRYDTSLHFNCHECTLKLYEYIFQISFTGIQ